MTAHRIRSILIGLTYFTLILLSGVIVYFFYLTFWPFNIVTLHGFTLNQTLVKRGELLSYNLNFTKHLNYKPIITYYLVDGVVYQFADGGTTRPIGDNNINKLKEIPKNIPAGYYQLRVELDYPIAPWRHITYQWTSEKFLVK